MSGLTDGVRSGRLRNALVRRRFELELAATVRPRASEPIEHIGSSYGGWDTPLGRIAEDSIVYSFGIGADVTWDLGVIERYGCEVWGFDPAPEAGEHVREVAGDESRLHFECLALWNADGHVPMWRSDDPSAMTLSGVNMHQQPTAVDVVARRLSTLMADHGHERIDILKVDVEGAEYDVIEPREVAAAGVEVVMIELHHTRPPHVARRLLGGFSALGYAVCARKLTNFTLVRSARAAR